MAKAGAHCFLIGEALMRAADVEQATREVLRAPVAETVEA
jgi:indole-3-glycerol phosphate synthase